jgi:hypothetical protein
MTRASKQTIVADSAQIGSTAIRRASGSLEQKNARELRIARVLMVSHLAATA